MDRYEAVLKRGLCLCRMAIDQLGFNCCSSETLQNSAEEHSALVTSNAKHDSGKKVITSTEVEIHPRCSYDAPKKDFSKAAPLLSNQGDLDVEKHSGREHVVLSVTGMTCTGCSKKMMNVLGAISGLSNAQVTFVSGSAEFDLDTSTSGTAEKVLMRIEKETGFKCFRIISGRQELSVLMTAETARKLQDASPAGLTSFQQGKKGLYTVTYDPTIIGARSLLPPDAVLAPPSDTARSAEGKRRLIETALSTSLAAILTIPVVVLEWSSNPIAEQTVSIITLVLGTCVQVIAIPEFYVGAMKSLIFSHIVEMDMLVVISITAAYAYSVVAFGLQRSGVELEQEAFFETSTMLITLVLLGRLIAAWARMRAVSAVSMRALQAETATLVSDKADLEEIDARLLQFGDTIAIGPHSRIVTDGQIVHGASEVDESMITGESLPVAKEHGDKVIAGTLNGSGSLHVAISRLPGENSITDIANLVENAVAAKPKVQELADKVASWFIPAVVGIALVVFFIWIAIAIEVRSRNAGGAIGLSVTYAIAVLAISCPCALGLAVPMVLVITGGIAARSGVIIKAADAIETSYKITDIIFDKTGTLTEGNLHVVFEESNLEQSLDIDEVRPLIYAMVEGNAHPVSVSVAAYLKERNLSPLKPALQSVTSIPGAGLEARFGDLCVKAGNPAWLCLQEHTEVFKHSAKAMTLLCVTLDGKLVAIYGLQSTLRTNAGSVVAELTQRNITCHIVSGDNSSAVLDVASVLNVARGNVLSCSSPAQKQQYVQDLQSRGKKVLFLGDGTNDAVAIAQADVGVQMGSASDVTGAVADVVLLSRNLESLLALLELSRSAVRRIVFNFAWSAIYNVFAILLASGAFVKFRIPPAYAGLGEIVSVLPVIIAAATLAVGRQKVA
ncbi:Putative P-type ATPase, heavy metal-associated domain, HMA, P-type ATPase, A domain superfamily [Septoria linicola]|uniref:P-type ATPase, heavy metal-associated domain, HMA, P-type ATPase, A domain superfamily n=1 Tax=Septoria linicola TaxID=215465 RepID=A0A9Q9AMK3_9PEZI|nr:putative P-type ATPase, heavy metal-associated domain, HMA, P-type ATPase, A domain superfamily [Septoria linicola]USW50874.1 Putative P-type ATPase, heavy metal-associated domain, HMA, P-type ATPase, A domain superfamily [Septoria linicola]